MSSSPLFARHKLVSFLLVVALALSFVVPAYAQETEDDPALASDEAALEADGNMADAEADVTDQSSDLETAQQRTGCQGILTLDAPTGGTVTGVTLISGWLADAANPFNPGGPVDLYRGDTFVATAATGASRDPGNVRSDVDQALSITDGRTGWFIRMDWSSQPSGTQTYRVLGRTSCEWLEKTFTVNVNPAPPAPAAGLSISDESRTLSNSNYNTGVGVGSSCIQYNSAGQCVSVSTVNTGVGTTCIQYNTAGQCIQYSNTGYGYNTGYTTQSDVNFEFNVTLSPASTQQVQVDYATRDGSAVNGTDYTATNGTLTFAAGETSKNITVRVYNRGVVSASDRDFFVTLSNPRGGAGITDGEGRGIIRRNYTSNSGCVQFDVNGNCISYGNSGTGLYGNCPAGYYYNGAQCIFSGSGGTGNGSIFFTGTTSVTCPTRGSSCSFTIQQSGGINTATVTYSVNSSSAVAGATCTTGVDVAPQTGASGGTTGTVLVGINSTAIITVNTCVGSGNSPNEVFTVSLSSTNSGFIGTPSSATGTISPI